MNPCSARWQESHLLQRQAGTCPKAGEKNLQGRTARAQIEPRVKAKDEESDDDYREVSYDEPGPREMIASLKEEVKAAQQEESTSFITFTPDSEVYAVPIQTIEEIIGQQEISPAERTELHQGVINLRGELVPIMDLRLKFGLSPKEYTQFTVFHRQVDERLMGMVVDNVADVLVIDPQRSRKGRPFSAKISTEFTGGIQTPRRTWLSWWMSRPS